MARTTEREHGGALRGTGAKKPILLMGHLDVVEAKREDWTSDPFQFVEKDGYFYAARNRGHEGGMRFR